MSGSGISWAICKSAPRSTQITMPTPHQSEFYRPDALPAAQPTASKHRRQPLKHQNVKTQPLKCTINDCLIASARIPSPSTWSDIGHCYRRAGAKTVASSFSGINWWVKSEQGLIGDHPLLYQRFEFPFVYNTAIWRWKGLLPEINLLLLSVTVPTRSYWLVKQKLIKDW